MIFATEIKKSVNIPFKISRAEDGIQATPTWVSVSSEALCRDSITVNGEERPVYISLSHASGAVLGTWEQDGIVLRDRHGGEQVGVIKPAYIRDSKLGGDKIIWSVSEKAQVIARDVENGVRRNLSVEGAFAGKDLIQDGEKDGLPVMRATRWTLHAAAFCVVPADSTVGVARSHDATEKATPEAKEIKPPEAPAIIVRSNKMELTEQQIKERDAQRAKETTEIFALARDYNVPQEQVTRHITEGKGLAEFQGIILRDFSAAKAKADAERAAETAKTARKQEGVSSTVPAEKLAQFSFMRAIRGMAKSMKPDLDIQDEDYGLEREISQEQVRLIRQNPEGKTYTPRGLCIPWDLVRSNGNGAIRREFNIAGTGSNVVAQNLRPELFIDYLRAKLILAKLGVTTLTGLVGDVLIPKQSGTAAATWVDETTAGNPSTLTVGQIKVTPRTLGAYTDISRQLLLQSTPSADMLVMNDLTDSLARSIQTGAFHGTGANNQPVGLFTAMASGYQGFAAITEATVSSDGNPTYAEIEALLAGVEEANVDGELKFAMRPKAFRTLKGVGRVGTTGAIPIAIEENGVKYVADAVAETTTSLTSKYVAAGKWDSMVMAMWGALDLTLDPYSLSTRGALRVVALQSVDIGFRYLPAFGWSSKFAASA